MASVLAFRSNDSAAGMDSELSGLLDRVADGDRQAFSRLYDHVSARLYGVILRILPKSELAEDALQEAFVRIWQKASTYDPSIAAPMAWMATIARNRAIDLKRRFAERLSRQAEELDPATADQSPGPLALAEQSDEYRRLRKCLDGLPGERQEMVLLAYHQGWSREELALRFKRPITTVKTLLRRSLLALKECLDAA
jgi:RNA polymerase sigma-70 factor (ECF subfamily)